KNKLSDFLFGKMFEGLISQTAQCVFLTRFAMPLNVHPALHLFCAPFAEREAGFSAWLTRVLRLASQVSMSITLYASEETHREMQEFMAATRSSVALKHIPAAALAEGPTADTPLHANDMLMWVLSRKGNVSHSPAFQALPARMVRVFSKNSVVFVYPETRILEGVDDYALAPDGTLLERGITLLKGAKGIFQKNQNR
ncbi:MAG TPA: hypothetical protein VK658_20675, partial [Chryseolinea sp.]|nr:hypothetical protein [Chryseolinea sp.]